jgi:hypothetical protein
LRGRRDLCRLRFFGKLARLKSDKLLKRVFLICKPITGGMATTWCGGTRKLLFDLGLGHVWRSENVGTSKDWEKVIYSSIKARELQTWKQAMQKKEKLRLYRTIKPSLERESYLVLPLETRRRLSEIRCGTHCLRIETGRWLKEAPEERFCRVCLCGSVEDELHALLECWQYAELRKGMFLAIKAKSGFDVTLMVDDREWLRDFLIGVGPTKASSRLEVSRIVGTYFRKMFLRREALLP